MVKPNWLDSSVLYKCIHGSRAYGTNTEDSDVDIKGICVPPKEYYLGFKEFEQYTQKVPDLAIYEIQKFTKLALNANPNIFEILFVDDASILYMSPIIKPIFENRDSFLSKKVKSSFFGYAKSHLKEIERTRKWLRDPPNPPKRSDFDLPEQDSFPKGLYDSFNSQVQSFIDTFQLDLSWLDDAERLEVTSAIKSQLYKAGLNAERIFSNLSRFSDSEALKVLLKENEYRSAKREYEQYLSHLRDRNPKRLELEKKVGYDGKDAGHLIRLLFMAEEICSGKGVIVKRPDWEYLLEVRRGEILLHKLMEQVEIQIKRIEEAYKTTKLPNKPDEEKIQNIVMEIIYKHLQ
jgi:predicted nucleotidyltransferase